MTTLALGGTLDDWSFVFNILTAVGTLAAVVVALALAYRADQRASAADHQRRRNDARAVLAVALHEVDGRSQPGARIVNGGDGAITDIHLHIDIKTRPLADLVSWGFQATNGATCIRPYLLPGAHEDLIGAFHPRANDLETAGRARRQLGDWRRMGSGRPTHQNQLARQPRRPMDPRRQRRTDGS